MVCTNPNDIIDGDNCFTTCPSTKYKSSGSCSNCANSCNTCKDDAFCFSCTITPGIKLYEYSGKCSTNSPCDDG